MTTTQDKSDLRQAFGFASAQGMHAEWHLSDSHKPPVLHDKAAAQNVKLADWHPFMSDVVTDDDRLCHTGKKFGAFAIASGARSKFSQLAQVPHVVNPLLVGSQGDGAPQKR